LGIPVVAILDTNSNPQGIDYPIPGNDDAARSISLYCDLVARAALDGMESQLGKSGVDVGGMEVTPTEKVLVDQVKEEENNGTQENIEKSEFPEVKIEENGSETESKREENQEVLKGV
jgi:small subunit ribosomal protein S2